MARLGPRQSMDAATAALRSVQPGLREETLPHEVAEADRVEYLTPPMLLLPASTGASRVRERFERPLLTMLVAVALVLVIACTNVANLLLARATARRHEWSVRLALGASRGRLGRQLLTESLLLSAAGALIGAALAPSASRLLVHALSTRMNPIALDLAINGRVLLFTTAVTIATAMLFGVAPALRAADAPPIDAIKEHGRGAASSSRSGMIDGLVVAQVALSIVLLVAAGLFIRTFASLATRDPGFDREWVLQAEVDTRQTTIDIRDRLDIYVRLRDRVAAVPGVAYAGASFEAPFRGGGWEPRVDVPDGVLLPEPQRRSYFNGVTSGWFATYGIPILAGRDISDRDQRSTPPVIVVNEAFARRFFNGASPIGHTAIVQFGSIKTPPREIVGLVADTLHNSPREQPPPTMYIPLAQFDSPRGFVPYAVNINVRSAIGSPALLSRSVGAAIAEVNRDLGVTFRPVAEQIHASLTRERVVAMLAGIFGTLSLLLAGLGLYGVTSYAVACRRPELGVRLALGAAPDAVVRLVLSRVSRLVAFGIVVGVGSSLWASQFVASLLYGLQPRDPVTLIAAAALLGSVGLLAGWLPARRAARIDPLTVLRDS